MGNRPRRLPEVMDWLLEGEQPAIRYLALTELLGTPQTDPEVRSVRKAIPVRGWAADILARQESGGWWAGGESLYRPKYLSSNWIITHASRKTDWGGVGENSCYPFYFIISCLPPYTVPRPLVPLC